MRRLFTLNRVCFCSQCQWPIQELVVSGVIPIPLSAALSLPCPPLPQNSPLKFSWGLGSPVSSHRGPGARRQTPFKGILSPKNRF